ncbi:MAG: hypothetical protein IJY79_03555 [Clostridia bacterium]|nr:hypothetical protein [Clostridia bacterium]
MSEKKTKKEKITYIDDGRTIADMSNLPPRANWAKKGTTSSFKDIWRTYWQATKMMLKPTLVAVGFLVVIYLIVTIIFWLM